MRPPGRRVAGNRLYTGAAVAAAPIVGYNVGVGNDEKIQGDAPCGAPTDGRSSPFFAHRRPYAHLNLYHHRGGRGARGGASSPPVSARHTRLSSAQSRRRHPLRRRAARGHGSARGAAAGNLHGQRRNRNHSRKSKPKSRPRPMACRRPSSAISTRICSSSAKARRWPRPPAAISTPGRSASGSPPLLGQDAAAFDYHPVNRLDKGHKRPFCASPAMPTPSAC